MTAPVQAGPFRVLVRRAELGVTVDVGHFIGVLLRELADQAREDPDGVLDDLAAIADADSAVRATGGRESYAEHERDALVDALLDRIGGAELHLATMQARRLAQHLDTAADTAPTITLTERTAA